MRMVNRLIEPTSGTIRIDGQDTRGLDVETLRRSIGYVIQQVGLFPHRSVLDNVGTVPTPAGLGRAPHPRAQRRAARPRRARAARPSATATPRSCRVASASASASLARSPPIPPVMLMDEPFGAIDPLVREQIQDEFLRMQQDVRKTIIIVTHDLDEAMRMGDKVAVLQEGGVLAQLATPEELLAAPANDFVRRFVGGDVALRRLGLARVHELPLMPLDVAHAQGFGLYVDDEGRPVQWADGRPVRAVVAARRDAAHGARRAGRLR